MGQGPGVKTSRAAVALVMCAVCGINGGCGVVGPPIPPENVGVAPIIEKQKKLQEQKERTGQEDGLHDGPSRSGPMVIEPRGQDEELPPLRPVGIR